ncbi:hypothetical protein DPEC_G00332160 [Dallia pectoralis]|uniref:Uncharacterized protein n=1 Tax=Dallia pectoralis TaxID=75939 RepID=A0ACC2F618_DALPE|nr:hypothetical protein DPEC_G00332160 [Dallia pectoralis]
MTNEFFWPTVGAPSARDQSSVYSFLLGGDWGCHSNPTGTPHWIVSEEDKQPLPPAFEVTLRALPDGLLQQSSLRSHCAPSTAPVVGALAWGPSFRMRTGGSHTYRERGFGTPIAQGHHGLFDEGGFTSL